MSQPVERSSESTARAAAEVAASAAPTLAQGPVPATPAQQGSGAPGGPVSATRPRDEARRRSGKAQRRHARVVVRKVGPWSVFKVSVIFYLCVMAVLLGAGVILYTMLSALGLIDSLEGLADQLGFGPSFRVHGSWLFARGLGIGLAMVVLWSLINVFVAFLYNLISDLVGGVEITLGERR